MAHARGGFVASGRLGDRRSVGQAVPIPTSFVPGDYPSDGCPAGFRRIFGVCQMDVPAAATVWTTPFVIAGRAGRGR